MTEVSLLMRKTLALLLALVMIFTLLTSCSSSPAAPTATTAPVTRTFTDSVGRTVELPANITRIAPSGALAQMFLIAIAPDLLCTVAQRYNDDAVRYVPAYLNDLPEVGQFYGMDNLNFESIATIKPEVVIDLGEPKNTIVEDMDGITEKLAIPAIHITADLRGTPEAFRTLGKLLGREAKGKQLAAYCEKVLAKTDELVTLANGDKPTILYCLGDAGINVLAKGSFHSEVLDYIAENAAVVDAPSSKGSGNEVSLEQISVWNPDVIIFAPNSAYPDVGTDKTWSELDAIKNGRYAEVPGAPYNWMGSPPSINRYLGMIWLSYLLYADGDESDLNALITEYYKLFYDHELTVAEYDALLANSRFGGTQ
jgi:iron complex transport system substrate-binding protein